jgi:aryl-alcohol dehydrogenase-like predicted oxidoreductase
VSNSLVVPSLGRIRFKSRADFEEGDLRLAFPRFSEENFPKNLAVVDKLKEISKKIGNISSSQVALAWILAEYPNCEEPASHLSSFITDALGLMHFQVFPIPGCRSVERLEENAVSAEIQLSPTDVAAIRKLAEEADGAIGDRYPSQHIPEGNCIPLTEWKGE